MTANLTPEQQEWLRARIETGEFQSIGDAVSQLVDEDIALRSTIGVDDLAWAKPLVDEALEAVERGQVVGHTAYRLQLTQMLASKR